MPPKSLVLALVVLGVVLTVSVVPGVFLVDDNNYLINVLALRQGRVTVANTEGLTPSRELLFFDPSARSREVTATPIASTAPPLYAPMALPFSWFGWRGLVALNTLAYLATILLVFHYTGRHATAPQTPWLAAGAFAFGGYAIEYALGLWPQALSFALCTGAIVLAGSVIEGAPPQLAAAAGFLLAIATGVRYQNAVVLAAVGAGIVLWTPRRWRAVTSFAAAAAVPLSASAVFNHVRFGSWNPVSKGPGYLDVPVASGAGHTVQDALVMFWARVVDFSMRPPLRGPDIDSWLRYDPVTGVHLLLHVTAKKALLQSAPWAILALILFGVAWIPAVRMPTMRRHQLRLLSLVTCAILGTFAVAGVGRHDGLSFNERYLLEVLPLAAVAFAWALDDRALALRTVGAGAGAGIVLVLLILLGTPVQGGPERALWVVRQVALMKAPLVLAATLAVIWIASGATGAHRGMLGGLVGACLGWGLMNHLGTDVFLSQFVRQENLRRTRALEAVLPDRSAAIGHWGGKDAVVPLLFTRDIVILDAWADDGRDAPRLIRGLLSSKRRVFVLKDGFAPTLLHRVDSGLLSTPVTQSALPIVELRHGSE